jgi:hypothetical protein
MECKGQRPLSIPLERIRQGSLSRVIASARFKKKIGEGEMYSTKETCRSRVSTKHHSLENEPMPQNAQPIKIKGFSNALKKGIVMKLNLLF